MCNLAAAWGTPTDPADLLTEAGFVDLHEDRVVVTVHFADSQEALAMGHVARVPGVHRGPAGRAPLRVPCSDALVGFR